MLSTMTACSRLPSTEAHHFPHRFPLSQCVRFRLDPRNKPCFKMPEFTGLCSLCSLLPQAVRTCIRIRNTRSDMVHFPVRETISIHILRQTRVNQTFIHCSPVCSPLCSDLRQLLGQAASALPICSQAPPTSSVVSVPELKLKTCSSSLHLNCEAMPAHQCLQFFK